MIFVERKGAERFVSSGLSVTATEVLSKREGEKSITLPSLLHIA